MSVVILRPVSTASHSQYVCVCSCYWKHHLWLISRLGWSFGFSQSCLCGFGPAVHGKGAKRRRDSEVSAAAAAAAAAEQQTAAHPVSGGLSQPHPQQAGKHPSDQKQAGAAASEAAAAAASGGGGGAVAAGVGLGPVGLGPAAAGAAGAAAAGAADHPRVRGSGPQLDMMTGQFQISRALCSSWCQNLPCHWHVQLFIHQCVNVSCPIQMRHPVCFVAFIAIDHLLCVLGFWGLDLSGGNSFY